MADAFLYEVVHRASGRSYVGVTRQRPEQRWAAHRADARRGAPTRFARALAKYGREAFDWSVIAWCASIEIALEAEREEIARRRPAFNLTDGGEGTLNPSEETRAKMRGPKSEEHRAAISASATRRAQTAEGRAHLDAVRFTGGRAPDWVASDATRAKMSASAKARCTPEWRERHAANRRGAKASAETRAKLSAVHLKYPPGTACVICAGTTKRIRGFGQCETCYAREYARARRRA